MRAVVAQLSGRFHARKILTAQDNPGIGLIVLEQNIIARLMCLDQRVFQKQSILLATNDNMADGADLLNEHTNLGGMILIFNEVRRHTLAQRLCLTDIDYLALTVQKLIHTGLQR